MRWKAVIFDFDGVLADTMEDNYQAWAHACSQIDIALQREEYFLLEGLNVRQVAVTLLERYNKDLSHKEFLASEKERFYLQHNNFALYQETAALLQQLYGKVALGLVTGAGMRRLESTLDTSFFELFDVVVSGDDKLTPKPDPAPYLKALDRLKLSSDQAVVVENAPLGIQSAKDAGLCCLAVTSTLEQDFLMQADDVVDDLAHVAVWLADRLQLSHEAL